MTPIPAPEKTKLPDVTIIPTLIDGKPASAPTGSSPLGPRARLTPGKRLAAGRAAPAQRRVSGCWRDRTTAAAGRAASGGTSRNAERRACCTHGGPARAKTIGWLAIETGAGSWNGHNYRAGTTSNSVTHNWHTISFGSTFSQAPRFIAGISTTYDGKNGSALRYRSLTSGSVQVKVEEDTTLDSETSHTTEAVSYLAIQGNGTLTGQVYGGHTETKYYYAGTARVAVRKNGALYYLLSDHLGSTSVTVDAQGNKVAELRYFPFGEVRYAWGSQVTEYTYTGQRSDETDAFGLMYYRARWYDPALGRFAQADTIVPGAGNPLAYDRYAYVYNNPLKYVDPSGHLVCSDRFVAPGDCSDEGAGLWRFGVELVGDWSDTHKEAVRAAVMLVGARFAEEIGGSPWEAFQDVYGLNDDDTFIFEWDENCWGCRADPVGCDAGTTTGDACTSAFGYTNGENWIEFASMSQIDVPLRNINNVIYELGHAFNIRLDRTPENALATRGDLLVRDEGFYGAAGNITWQQSRSTTSSEIFADQFLGWTYGKWGHNDLGQARADFMNQMNGSWGWVTQASRFP